MINAVIILIAVIGCGLYGFGTMRFLYLVRRNKDFKKNKKSYNVAILSALLGAFLMLVTFIIDTFVLH